MGGGKGGKGGGGSNINVQPSPYEQAMAQIAQEIYQSTKPLRSNFLEDWQKFMRPYGTGTSSVLYPGTTAAPATGQGAAQVPAGGGMAYSLPFSPDAGANTQATQKYAPKEWANIFTGPNAPTLPAGISTTPLNPASYATMQPINFTPAGYIAGQAQNPIFSYPSTSGRYFDRQGQEYFGDPRQILWAEGYSPATTGSGTTTTTTAPTGYQGTSTQFGAYNPYNIPGYQPLYQLARQGVESQFSQARNALIGSLPRGGSLGQGLSDLEIQRAIQAGSLPAQIASPLIQDIMSKAYGAAWSSPQQSLGGLAGAAGPYAQRYGATGQYQLGSQAQGLSTLGGLGSLAAMGAGKGGKGLGDFAGASALGFLV